ncbi:unnamed protein product [Penicillium salamii]|uniref:Cytochrome P450 n=1 Tax=Penicillium salamii TaxID=1612424 RepID=A0A9W4J758_9EURO|nr:unnamed protein product [Penicillium salamii]CAG8376273.1 unnamed protein product [Penicillium salamii]CAG8378527.1 unnamed protein product [Penicillium salamii]CAG8412048.1 unnamed protein product [Penicillium salamii]
MAPVSLNLIQFPFYGVVAGAVVFVFCAVKVTQALRRWNFARQNGCQPPASSVCHGWFGIGMIMEMVNSAREHNFTEQIRGWHSKYGTTFTARMANRKTIFTTEAKNIQTILALKFKDYSIGPTRQNALRPVFGEGIFTVDGSRWEHSRALLRPNFSRAQITNTEMYENHVTDLMKHVPHDGSTVELQDLFLRQTLDTASEFLFGESVHSLRENNSTEAALFAKQFNTATDGTATRIRMGPLMMLYRNKEYWKAGTGLRDYIDKFVQKAIDYRIAVDSGQKVDPKIKELTDNQYVFSYELSKQTLDKKEITDQLLSILIAGRDTTANLLSITFFILARRPDIWDRLRSEVLALDGRKPSFEDLKSMTYMSWVFNESLRLYPIVPFNFREARRDTILPVGGGPDGKSPVFVAKGQEVTYSVYTMHRDPAIYGPDADEYRPERWEKIRPGWAYLPFNGGPRICIGQQFALTEAGYTTVRILQEFEKIESRDPNPWVEDMKLTLSSANGTRVSLTPVVK